MGGQDEVWVLDWRKRRNTGGKAGAFTGLGTLPSMRPCFPSQALTRNGGVETDKHQHHERKRQHRNKRAINTDTQHNAAAQEAN